MFKLLILGCGLCHCGLASADCDFVIINYTDSAVSVKAGFYGKNASSLIAAAADTSIIRLKSDVKCNDSNAIGLGQAYIMFPNDSHGAGANYSPSQGGLNFMGKFTGDASGRLMTADNGTPIWLNASGLAIDDSQFQVKLNFIGRPSSRSAGTQ